MKVTMSCRGQKMPQPQDSTPAGCEDLTQDSHPGGKEEMALLAPPGSMYVRQGGPCPQCRQLQRVVYVVMGLLCLAFILLLLMGLVQYFLYKDTLDVRQRLGTFCPASPGAGGADPQQPASPAPSAPPGPPAGQAQQVGTPPRGADVPGGPWDHAPLQTDHDFGEEEDMEEDEGHRSRRSVDESGGRSARGGRRTRHDRHKRCISCPTNMTTVEHLEGHPNSIQEPVTTDYGGANPFKKGDMFRHWRMTDWSTGVKNAFNSTTGYLTIADAGLYWIYGQVMFYNEVFENGFAVRVFRRDNDVPQELAMCMHTTDYNDPNNTRYNEKYRTCNVGLPAMLSQGDRIGIASLYEGRMVVFSPTSSFWGIIKQSPPAPSP